MAGAVANETLKQNNQLNANSTVVRQEIHVAAAAVAILLLFYSFVV